MYEDLYLQNEDLLKRLARRWAPRCDHDRAVSVEDLTQAGFFGLVKAAETFDENAGRSWAGWAGWFIRKEFERALCLREGKATRAHTGALALDAPVKEDSEDGATFSDLLPDESLPEIDADLLTDDLKSSVQKALEQLEDQRGRQIVQGCDLDGKPFRVIAAELGVSAERVRQLRNRAHSALKSDKRLRAYAERLTLDDLTRFYAHKGVAAFHRDNTSVTEAAALWRIEHQKNAINAGAC